MSEDELELNTLHRLRKQSNRLVLEAHGSCEVPAGCGGVVLRWLNPAHECYLLFTVCAGDKFQLFLDGQPIRSSAFTVPAGRHVLALHAPESASFLLAVQKHTHPHQELLFSSQADGSWQGTHQPPPPNWAQPDFAADWPVLTQVTSKAKGWNLERLEEMGAKPLGLDKGTSWLRALSSTKGPLWVRRSFEVP